MDKGSSWHRLRKAIHLVCFLVFLALPFLNVIRADIPHQRFYFFGYELWINEFAIIFFALMFLMFLVVASSVFYGRVYCGYLCPQMIFSEASVAVESFLRRRVAKKLIAWKPARRERLVRVLFYAAMAIASVFLAFLFIAYFVEPRDLFHRLASLDIHTAAGISGAAVTILTFLDFSLVRQKFCTTVCPYGYLQGMLGDGDTLLVHYRDAEHACIECKKCVRICPMGIDIRESPFQIECIHCGECIDACDEILARLHKPGLIHYTWGEKGERLNDPGPRPWYRRIGLRDPKRVVVLLVLTFYAAGLLAAFSMRHAVLVRIAPIRATLYRVDAAGRVFNRFRYSVSNRGHAPTAVILSIQHLPGATLAMEPNPIPVAAGQTAQGEFEISAPPHSQSALVSHFTIETSTVPDQARDTFPMTFLAPPERQAP
ncbi:Type cbb3 cytochrome oxidase biogenesis protein CcoG, involved in Cu oxidation [Candidatus Sulfopaludibacter sp. SbA3]|nr:Type cbb3 cytochrome oxidase biogenesis protein CcoG, involved in Cu oxidation [Candidatus Sulfopaludibacter sp. SbA3]